MLRSKNESKRTVHFERKRRRGPNPAISLLFPSSFHPLFILFSSSFPITFPTLFPSLSLLFPPYFPYIMSNMHHLFTVTVRYICTIYQLVQDLHKQQQLAESAHQICRQTSPDTYRYSYVGYTPNLSSFPYQISFSFSYCFTYQSLH